MASVKRPSTVRAFIRSDRAAGPERRLMAAVLQGVVDDLRGSVSGRARGYGSPTDSPRHRAAVAYVDRRDREWPFSFENLCDALSLDPGRLRHELGRARVPGTLRVTARSDRILFGKYSGSEIKIDGEEHLIVREEDVLGVVEA
jgi:hypothetical protein